MDGPIIIYDNGETYEIDSSELYDPFPEPEEKPTDDSQDLQTI